MDQYQLVSENTKPC